MTLPTSRGLGETSYYAYKVCYYNVREVYVKFRFSKNDKKMESILIGKFYATKGQTKLN